MPHSGQIAHAVCVLCRHCVSFESRAVVRIVRNAWASTRGPTDLALSCAARLLRLDWNSSVRRQAAESRCGRSPQNGGS